MAFPPKKAAPTKKAALPGTAPFAAPQMGKFPPVPAGTGMPAKKPFPSKKK
jgi:hypothetical protein